MWGWADLFLYWNVQCRINSSWLIFVLTVKESSIIRFAESIIDRLPSTRDCLHQTYERGLVARCTLCTMGFHPYPPASRIWSFYFYDDLIPRLYTAWTTKAWRSHLNVLSYTSSLAPSFGKSAVCISSSYHFKLSQALLQTFTNRTSRFRKSDVVTVRPVSITLTILLYSM